MHRKCACLHVTPSRLVCVPRIGPRAYVFLFKITTTIMITVQSGIEELACGGPDPGGGNGEFVGSPPKVSPR